MAKKVGKMFRSLGLLSKGEVVVTDRTQLVGRFIGQTEENVRNVLRQAQGNVLFIDEAYTLCDTTTDRKDFGYRVLECLLTVLTQSSPARVPFPSRESRLWPSSSRSCFWVRSMAMRSENTTMVSGRT